MPEDQRIEELLDQWEDLHESGELLSFDAFVDRFCADASEELLDALRSKIAAIESMNALLDCDQRPEEALRDTRGDAEVDDTQDATIRLKAGAEPVPGYELVSPLGEGGFGEVWKAMGPGGFHVALKFVRLDRSAAEPELRAIEITRNLRHPNLLSIFGTWQKQGWLIIASELAGRSLLDRLRLLLDQGETGIPARELCSYMNDAARAIDYLNKPHHPLGDGKRGSIQHRDLKPGNLLLSGGGVKVADFGIARFLEQHVTSHTGAMSVAYAAPEFFDGKTSNRSDQYSLAVTYCELRGGRLPFTGTDIQKMRGHVEGVPDLSMLPEVERPVVLRALAKKPEDRWPNCRAFVRAIEEAALPGATPLAQPASLADEKGIGWTTLISGIVVLLVVGAVWVGMQIEGDRKRAESPASDGLASRVDSATAKRNGETAKTVKEKTPVAAENLSSTRSVAELPSSTSETDSPVAANPSTSVPAADVAEPAPQPLTISKATHTLNWRSLVSGVAFSPDGRRIVGGSQDMMLRVCDAETGEVMLTLKGHSGWVNCVEFSPNARRIISGSEDKTLKVWDSESGREKLTFRGHTGQIWGAAFSPDGRQVVSGDTDNILKLWDAETGKESLTLRGHTHRVRCVAFSLDGRQIVSGSDDETLKVWDAESGRMTLTLKGHSSPVMGVAFGPVGRRIVSGGSDGTLKVWDGENGGEILTFRGHAQPLTCLALSRDGQRIVSGSHEGTLKVWDAETGHERLTLQGHTGSVYSVAFSPDGQRIASGSSDGTLRVWDVSTRLPAVAASSRDVREKRVPQSPEPSGPVSASQVVPDSPTDILTSGNWKWSKQINLGPVVNTNRFEAAPELSADGLTLLFASERPGGVGDWDLWMSTRAVANGRWRRPVNLGSNVNSTADDESAALSSDGLTLVFSSNRPGGVGGWDTWISTREGNSALWGKPVNLGAPANSPSDDWSTALSSDGLTLLFSSSRPGGSGGTDTYDIWMSTRPDKRSSWGEPVNLGSNVNSTAREETGTLSSDGLTLIFGSYLPGARPDKPTPFVLWKTTRPTVNQPFGRRTALDPQRPGWAAGSGASLSADGRTLIFHSNRGGGQGGWDLWSIQRVRK